MDPTSSRIAFGAAGGSLPAEIDSFTLTLISSSSGTFSWETSNAETVSINQGIGNVAVSGSINVNFSQSGGLGATGSNTYTLTATGLNGVSVTSSITVTCTIICTGRVVWGRCFGGSGLQPSCSQ